MDRLNIKIYSASIFLHVAGTTEIDVFEASLRGCSLPEQCRMQLSRDAEASLHGSIYGDFNFSGPNCGPAIYTYRLHP